MKKWDELLSGAETVDAVMALMGEYLGHLRSEHHHFLLPPQCRIIVLRTPSDVYWWHKQLDRMPAGVGTARMILQTARATFAVASQRLGKLGYPFPDSAT